MAKKKTDKDQATGGFDARALIALAGAALAVIGPVVAVAGRTIQDRRDRAATPAFAVVPIVGVVLAVLAGAAAWLNRDRVLEAAGDAVATAGDVLASADDLATRVADEAAERTDPVMSPTRVVRPTMSTAGGPPTS